MPELSRFYGIIITMYFLMIRNNITSLMSMLSMVTMKP